jgi:hypothetical protein
MTAPRGSALSFQQGEIRVFGNILFFLFKNFKSEDKDKVRRRTGYDVPERA